MYVGSHTDTHVCTPTCIHRYMYAHICMYAYIHIYTHILYINIHKWVTSHWLTHTHTHTHTPVIALSAGTANLIIQWAYPKLGIYMADNTAVYNAEMQSVTYWSTPYRYMFFFHSWSVSHWCVATVTKKHWYFSHYHKRHLLERCWRHKNKRRSASFGVKMTMPIRIFM